MRSIAQAEAPRHLASCTAPSPAVCRTFSRLSCARPSRASRRVARVRCRTQGRWRRWQDSVPQGPGGSARRHRDGALPGRRGARVHLPPHAQPRRAHGNRDQEADADGSVGLLQSYCLSMLSGSCRLALPVQLSARIPRLFSSWHVVVCVPLMCRSCAREWYKRGRYAFRGERVPLRSTKRLQLTVARVLTCLDLKSNVSVVCPGERRRAPGSRDDTRFGNVSLKADRVLALRPIFAFCER